MIRMILVGCYCSGYRIILKKEAVQIGHSHLIPPNKQKQKTRQTRIVII